MASAGARFEEDSTGQLECYRADLRRQFGTHCLTFAVALVVLLLLSAVAAWALAGIAIWILMLGFEARAVFGSSLSVESEEFCRWRRRQDWIAARNGDQRSLRRLQNVQ